MTISLLTLTLISFSILSSNLVSADNVVDEVNITVPIACTLTGTVNTAHTASINPGTYQNNIGTTTLKGFCNDSNGFAIYAAGYTGDEIGGTNSTKLVNSAINTNNTIDTGIATSGSTSTWAMKLTKTGDSGDTTGTNAFTIDSAPNVAGGGDASFSDYHTVPSAYTKVAHKNSDTSMDATTGGVSLTTTYASFIAGSQAPGTYTGKVIYTMVHPSSEIPPQPQPATAGCINYFANTGTAVGEMGCQSASNNAEVILWASNFSRAGYGFAGWNDKYDYTGNFYGPNQTITAPSDVSTNGLSLYAVWIKSAGTIQNWDGCNSLAQGSTTALTDERDGNTYAVAKLADNKCWMIENLRLDDSAELSTTNTHNPSLPITNVYDATNPTTSNHLSATTDPTTTAWCTSNSSACDDQSMLATNNTILFTNNTASSYSAGSNVYSYGNYYNWYSATAGHGKYGSSYASGYVAPGDICPAGWHLPKGGNKSQESTNEFWQLITTGLNNGVNPANYDSSSYPYYTGTEAIPVSNALRSYPNNFVYSGYVYGSSVNNRSSYGYYWSSSANSSSNAYNLYFGSSTVSPGAGSSYKYYGRMVRCVAGV